MDGGGAGKGATTCDSCSREVVPPVMGIPLCDRCLAELGFTGAIRYLTRLSESSPSDDVGEPGEDRPPTA